MHGLPVRQQYNTKISSFHLLNTRPTANTAILLNSFFSRVFNNLLYPLHPYHRPVRPPPHFLEVLREFHFRVFLFWADTSHFGVSSVLLERPPAYTSAPSLP